MPTSRILLITTAADAAVVDALQAETHEVAVFRDLSEAMTAAADREVVILDLAGPAQVTVDACGAIRATPSLAGIPILCVSPTDDIEDRIGLLEAGADDVIARPFDPHEFEARAEALALRHQRSRDLQTVGEIGSAVRDASHQRIIAFFSPKGGVGTTTVAVNVATALALQPGGNVAILDLDLQFGQVATHLNMTTRMTLADLALDETTLRDPGLFRSSLDRHSSGLMVLASPVTPDDGARITEETVATALTAAAASFQVVVVDAGSVLDRRTETVITRATDLVIVVTPEFPALKAVHALLEILAPSADSLGETSYILNEIFGRQLLRPRDIEEALGRPIALTIPYDAFAFLKSVNEGIPIVEGSPRSAAAEQLRRLAARLGGLQETTAQPERKSKGLGGLFGRG